MSIDKSLRRKNSLLRARSVLKRDERIKTLMDTDRWVEDRSPFGLPKVRVLKIVKKKAVKEKVAEGAEGAPAAEGAVAAAGKAPAGKTPAAKAPAAKAAPAAKPAGKK